MQLERALSLVNANGGAIVYLYQEGRGQGLFRKALAIHEEQSRGVDTAEAFQRLGYDLDPRDYSGVADALKCIDFPSVVNLATSNPRKIASLEAAGYRVATRVHLRVDLTPIIEQYLGSKVRGLGHYEQD